MALLTQLSLDTVRALSGEYGVDVERVEALSLGSVNSNFRLTTREGDVVFARLYEEQGLDGARAELGLLDGLAAAGVRVPCALPRRGEIPLHEGKPFAVFPWIEGEVVCLARLEPEHCRAVGVSLARVHGASSTLPALGPGRFQPADMLARLENVERTSSRADALSAAAEVKALLVAYRARREAGLPSGIVHGDLFRDNVLFRGHEIAALLDFESVSHGPFVYDLIVTIAAFCFRDSFDLRLAGAMVEGYESVRPLDDRERAAYRVEAALACLRFATSRITDFLLRSEPGATPKRDYRRFLARLSAIELGALDSLFRV